MKAGLILCPSWDLEWPVYPLALLSAELQARGHQALILDLNKETASIPAGTGKTPLLLSPWLDPERVRAELAPARSSRIDALIGRLTAAGARAAGFHVTYSNREMSLLLAGIIKQRAPEIFVVFGGPDCAEHGACLRFIRSGRADAVICGEADRTFPDLLDALDGGAPPPDAPGLLLRDRPETWAEGRDVVSDLDTLPFADYSGFRLKDYPRGKSLGASRGCVRRCAFCPSWRQGAFRTMSAGRIFEELDHQLRKDPEADEFIFADSALNADVKNLDALCGRILKEGAHVRWGGWAIARPELTRDFLEKMRRAGCAWLLIGVESGSRKVLAEMRKGTDPGVNARVLRDCKAAGIATISAFIVGYPKETPADFDETLSFLKEHSPHFRYVTPGLFISAGLAGREDRVGLAPGEHKLFWRTPDGRNDFPARLERLRRFLEVCEDRGIEAHFEGGIPASSMEDTLAELLSAYRSHQGRASAP